MTLHTPFDELEIAKFDRLAASWWDLAGELRTLHSLNPVRMQFIQQNIDLTDKKVLDVGCGGGILSESLAQAGSRVSGIDLSPSLIQIAKQHANTQDLSIDYQCIDLESFASGMNEKFDCITCMELLEHVPNPAFFTKQLAQLIVPDGLFFSTLNRTMKAYLLAIIGAEYILKLLPKKTHDYAKFIKPSELASWLREANCQVQTIQGVSYNPFTNLAQMSQDIDVNYMVYARA